MSTGTTIILSDLHLGRGPCSAASLRPLIEGRDRLILNGDSAELHLPGSERKARDEYERLARVCAESRVDMQVLEGNHDLGLSALRHVILEHGRVLVTHGDAFDPCVAPWTPWADEARDAVARVFAQLPEEARGTLKARFDAARAAAECEWSDPQRALKHTGVAGMLIRPKTVLGVLSYWRRFPRLAVEFAARFVPSARFIVCGHSHRPGTWERDGRIVLNTGHFEFPARPHAVVVGDGTISLWRIRPGRHGYELARSPRAAWPIAAASASRSGSTPLSIPQPDSR